MATNGTTVGENTRQTLSSTVGQLDALMNQVRADIKSTQEPKAQALFQTTAEVLIGLRKAFQDYEKGGEDAWR